MLRVGLPSKLDQGRSRQKQKDVNPVHHRVRKPSGLQWDEHRERQILLNFSRSIGREPSPTPSTGSRTSSKWTAYRLSQLNNGAQSVAQEQGEQLTSGRNNDQDTPHDALMVLPPDDDEDVSSAAFLFNKHESAHPFCQVAVQQLVEQIFSDEHLDAALSLRTSKMTEKLMQYGLHLSKSDLVTADLMNSARHAKASRLGRMLMDDMGLHAFLEDVKAGVTVPRISDTLRMWQRGLEDQMSGVEYTAVEEPAHQLPSPGSTQPSIRSSSEAAVALDDPQHYEPSSDSDPTAVDFDSEPDAPVFDADDHIADDFVRDSRRSTEGNIAFTHDSESNQFAMSGALPDSPRPEQRLTGFALPHRPVPGRTAAPAVTVSPPTPQEEQTQDETHSVDHDRLQPRSSPVVVTLDARQRQDRISWFSKRFADPEQVFVYHAHQALGRKCTPTRSQPKITARANALWSQLSEEERGEWNQLCAQLQSGDSRPLDSAIGADLLERQGLLDQLKAPAEEAANVSHHQSQTIADEDTKPDVKSSPVQDAAVQVVDYSKPVAYGRRRRSSSHAGSSSSKSSTFKRWKGRGPGRSGKPRAAFVRKSRQGMSDPSRPIAITCDDDSFNLNRIAFIVGAPDSLVRSMDPIDFVYSCETKFGNQIDPDRCRMLLPHLWVAHFKDPAVAQQMLRDGTSIVHKKVPIYGEPFPQATRMLVCCLTSTGVDPNELAKAIAAAFPLEPCRLLSLPKSHFALVFNTPRFIFRLYVPRQSRKSGSPSHVRFTPSDVDAACRACGKVHADVCSGAKEVILPRFAPRS